MSTIADSTIPNRDADRLPDEASLALERQLVQWLRSHRSVLIGFSGGVDSVYLACVAMEALGPEGVLAVIGRSPSYPAVQWETARQLAATLGIPVVEVATEELDDPRYAANPANRCYFCKSELWARLVPLARDRGYNAVVDGTNADDLRDHRPGARAAAEQGIRSPLAELGFTKATIRLLSQRRGLPTWSQPASPCLSSRIPYGTPVTIDRLGRIERAEAKLRDVGVRGDLRVRYHGDLARLEMDADTLERWLTPHGRAALRAPAISAGFDRVALDLSGFRSGSLNVLGGVLIERRAPQTHPSSAEQLEAALGALGVHGRVEARDRLAIVIPDNGSPADAFGRRELRAKAVAAAQAAGFTHVALELSEAAELLDADAALRRA